MGTIGLVCPSGTLQKCSEEVTDPSTAVTHRRVGRGTEAMKLLREYLRSYKGDEFTSRR